MKNAQHPVVIVLTTSKAQEDILKSYLDGANCFISKPVTFQVPGCPESGRD